VQLYLATLATVPGCVVVFICAAAQSGMAMAAGSYLGAKNGSGVYQAIINLMPPHDTYIEPFLGTGAVMRRKAPAARSIGLDKNQSCIDNFDFKGLVSNGYAVPNCF
jgi:hypothetical protein